MYSQFKSLSAFVTFSAILGILLVTNTSIVSQADAQVVFTEVDYHNDLIEIVNMGTSDVDISGWQLCSRFTYPFVSDLTVETGSTTLEPGGILVLSGFALQDAADLGLYNSGNFGSPVAMQSFVEWGGSEIGRESVAVSKGIWNTGEFVPPVPDGHSIEYDGVGISAGAWFDQTTPNFGAFGEEMEIPPPSTPWDVNGDKVVNIFDLVEVAGQFGQSGDGLVADVNGNGTVDIFDLVVVAARFGETIP